MSLSLDILAIVAHPDDAEIACGGTLIAHVHQEKKVGIVDLTRGESGTRGTPEIRQQEAEAAAKIMNLSCRETLSLPDAFISSTEENKRQVIQVIRKYRPRIILTNAPKDRHPDHVASAQLVKQAVFIAGLVNVKTMCEGKEQKAWKTKNLYHFIQSDWITPDFVVDVSPYWEQKMEAVYAFSSQFEKPDLSAQQALRTPMSTYVSVPDYLLCMTHRAEEFGLPINAKYAEGFLTTRHIGVNSLDDLQ